MFDNRSRYNSIATAKIKNAVGQVIIYKRRRFLPQGETMPLLAEVTVIRSNFGVFVMPIMR
jgi:hypothetical protein